MRKGSSSIVVGLVVSGMWTLACQTEWPTSRTPQAMDGMPAAEADVASATAEAEGMGIAGDLAKLIRVTAPYHSFERAQADGYTAKLTECMSDPAGGMGYHYGNPAFINGSVAVTEPEVLLYEPQKNGSLRLVGVEYVVPFGAWTAPLPPELFGQHFHRNEAFGLWALHVWVWRHNPSGLFADWNPRVSCTKGR